MLCLRLAPCDGSREGYSWPATGHPKKLLIAEGIPIGHHADRVADFGEADVAPVSPQPFHRESQMATGPEEIPEDATSVEGFSRG